MVGSFAAFGLPPAVRTAGYTTVTVLDTFSFCRTVVTHTHFCAHTRGYTTLAGSLVPGCDSYGCRGYVLRSGHAFTRLPSRLVCVYTCGYVHYVGYTRVTFYLCGYYVTTLVGSLRGCLAFCVHTVLRFWILRLRLRHHMPPLPQLPHYCRACLLRTPLWFTTHRSAAFCGSTVAAHCAHAVLRLPAPLRSWLRYACVVRYLLPPPRSTPCSGSRTHCRTPGLPRGSRYAHRTFSHTTFTILPTHTTRCAHIFHTRLTLHTHLRTRTHTAVPLRFVIRCILHLHGYLLRFYAAPFALIAVHRSGLRVPGLPRLPRFTVVPVRAHRWVRVWLHYYTRLRLYRLRLVTVYHVLHTCLPHIPPALRLVLRIAYSACVLTVTTFYTGSRLRVLVTLHTRWTRTCTHLQLPVCYVLRLPYGSGYRLPGCYRTRLRVLGYAVAFTRLPPLLRYVTPHYVIPYRSFTHTILRTHAVHIAFGSFCLLPPTF